MSQSVDTYSESANKFPHTRAQLGAIARLAGLDDDQEDALVPAMFLANVVALLGEEREDQLKGLLAQTYALHQSLVSLS